MWYLASQYNSEEQSKEVYQRIDSYVKHIDTDISVIRLLYPTLPHIVIIGETPETPVLHHLEHLVADGVPVQLPSHIITSLYERRDTELVHSTPLSTNPSKLYTETHIPTAIYSDGTTLSFTGTVMQTPDNSPLDVGSTVHINTIPFIKGYEVVSNAHAIDAMVNLAHNAVDKHMLHDEDIEHARKSVYTINDINNYVLRHSDKYIFTPSAIELLHTVLSHNLPIWYPLTRDTWIEFETPVTTPYANHVKAIYAHYAYPIEAINKLAPASKDITIHKHMHTTYGIYNYTWSLDIIDMRCKQIGDFTFDIRKNAWIFTQSHICTSGKCIYNPIGLDEIARGEVNAGECIPCDTCKQAVLYWCQYLHTAMRIIAREYALSPDDTSLHTTRTHTYNEQRTKLVGKGKNKRSIKENVTRSIDYRVVTFEVGRLPVHTPDTEETPASGKRANWLTLTDKKLILWEKQPIADYKRRYPIRKDNTRKTGTVTVHYNNLKWVPMLQTKIKRTIKKVTVTSQKNDTENTSN